MKILFCTDNLLGGGRERRLTQLIIGLHKIGISHTSLIVHNNTLDYPELINTDINIFVINKNKSYLNQLYVFYKLVRSIKPDIIHSWSVHISFYFVNIIRLFIPFKNIAGFIVTAQKNKFWSKQSIYEKICFTLADAIVANSTAGKLAKKAPDNKTYIIRNGFNFERLTNIDSSSITRKELAIQTKYVVTMAGRINIHKDYKMYVDVACEVNKIRNDVTFLIVGKGDMINEVLEYINDLNIHNIIITGFINDIESVINASDICVLCSNPRICPEGISNFIVESMALRKPVVATRGGGTNEIVIDGYNGFLIDSKDIKKATQDINDLLNDELLRNQIGENGHKEIFKNYLLDDMVGRYLNLYDSLLNTYS